MRTIKSRLTIMFILLGMFAININLKAGYDPTKGRFLNRDPIGEKDLEYIGPKGDVAMSAIEPYTFVRNNPINLWDHLGNCPVEVERAAKWAGYKFWKTTFLHKANWKLLVDKWFYEIGKADVTFTGLSNSYNKDIANNIGFKKLLKCWIAKQNGHSVPTGKGWIIGTSNFLWRYRYNPFEAAGGLAAYQSETHFLGSYYAYVTNKTPSKKSGKCKYAIRVENTSGWTSATRLPGFVSKFGITSPSIWTNHRRGAARYSPSTGGTMKQHYKFTVEEDCCAKCKLP